MHDMLYSKDLLNKMLPSLFGEETKNYKEFSIIQLKESCKNNEILRTPFELRIDSNDKSFEVNKAHQIAAFDPKKECFYSECIEDKIANLEIGHTLQINEQEKKLIYNIICHLYNHCFN